MLTASLFGWEDQGYDEAVETQNFSEDQNEDHAHEETRLLGGATDARVSHDADGKTRPPARSDPRSDLRPDARNSCHTHTTIR